MGKTSQQSEKGRWQETVNLPSTPFPMKGDLPRREPEILKFWEKISLWEKLENLPAQKTFVLHDGPPYANGSIHLGHVINKVLKDAVLKVHALQGERVLFVPGWDCHGLPIELKVEKEMKEKGENLPIVPFRKACREYAEKYIKIQREEFKRLGVLASWENPYLTMDFSYQGEIIQAFLELMEKGYIYRSYKPVFWCPDCITALAEAEVEYEEKESDSIYVLFPLTEETEKEHSLPHPTFLLIWTTTPWTLPANQAVAIHPEETYCLVHIPERGDLILSEKRIPHLKKILGENFSTGKSFAGKDLKGWEYIRPYHSTPGKVLPAQFVDLHTGTGEVHIAPGHGLEDYELGKEYNLPVESPVDPRGRLETPPFVQGIFVEEGNKKIIEDLKRRNLLLFEERIVHNYPHCWRCGNPILFRATRQYFLHLEHKGLRKRVMEEIEKVTWIPPRGKMRILSMVERRPDWCLSRQRRWGVPIPLFLCENCEEPLWNPSLIKEVKKRVEKEGADIWYTLLPEEIVPPETTCKKCGHNRFRKEEDILDVWFDSGISFRGVKTIRKEHPIPVDLYLEGSDQHRGWFQSSLILSVALRDEPPFRSVFTHGFVVDGEGKKMSKSLGNVITPEEIIREYGAEILRLWALSSLVYDDIRISPEIIKNLTETYRKIRNTIRFALSNIYDFDPKQHYLPFTKLHSIDQYYFIRLQAFTKEIISAYQSYEFHGVVHKINHFASTELSATYFDILKDRLYTFHPNSPERRSAQTVLYEILLHLLPLLAPVLSFTSEEAYQYLPGEKKLSVFLHGFPSPIPIEFGKKVKEEWETLFLLREHINRLLESARQEKKIHHSYEAQVHLYGAGETGEILKKYEEILPEWLIVSQVTLYETLPPSLPATPHPQLWGKIERAEGEKCARCWRYSPEVGENPRHPDLCPRCEEVVSALV